MKRMHTAGMPCASDRHGNIHDPQTSCLCARGESHQRWMQCASALSCFDISLMLCRDAACKLG